jgi:hypothetical protein
VDDGERTAEQDLRREGRRLVGGFRVGVPVFDDASQGGEHACTALRVFRPGSKEVCDGERPHLALSFQVFQQRGESGSEPP